jgi:hypothetical protein
LGSVAVNDSAPDDSVEFEFEPASALLLKELLEMGSSGTYVVVSPRFKARKKSVEEEFPGTASWLSPCVPLEEELAAKDKLI